MPVPPCSLAQAIRLHGRGLGRPFSSEEMVTLLVASGYLGQTEESLRGCFFAEASRREWIVKRTEWQYEVVE